MEYKLHRLIINKADFIAYIQVRKLLALFWFSNKGYI